MSAENKEISHSRVGLCHFSAVFSEFCCTDENKQVDLADPATVAPLCRLEVDLCNFQAQLVAFNMDRAVFESKLKWALEAEESKLRDEVKVHERNIDSWSRWVRTGA